MSSKKKDIHKCEIKTRLGGGDGKQPCFGALLRGIMQRTVTATLRGLGLSSLTQTCILAFHLTTELFTLCTYISYHL